MLRFKPVVVFVCTLTSISSFAQSIPFSVPTELSSVGAANLNITTNRVVRLKESELRAADNSPQILSLIQNALQNDTTVIFPSGTYRIPGVIFISGKTNLVLKGSVDQNGFPTTILSFPQSLTDVYGNNTKVYGSHGAWHGGGGFITVGKKHPFYSNGQSLASQNIGIQSLKLVFDRGSYNINCEAGYNAIYFNGVSQSYARDVIVENADNAFMVSNSRFTTVYDVVVNAIRDGHFGVVIFGGDHNRIENFNSISGMRHQLAVQKTSLNLFKNCKTSPGAGDSVSYRGGAKLNLFWNIAAGSSILGASNGQDKNAAITYGEQEYYWNCSQRGVNFTPDKVPSFLNGYVFAYYGPNSDPFKKDSPHF